MPSSTDFFNLLTEVKNGINEVDSSTDAVKASVDQVKASTDAVKGAVDQVNQTLISGFAELITIGNYTNEALSQNAKQNDTIICILEKISRNTCAILNEAHTQTRLQTSIERSAGILATLYAATHADAELERQRNAALQAEIDKCCPPPTPRPPCEYEPCAAPEPLREPPKAKKPKKPEEPK
jgi:hypothetical protein